MIANELHQWEPASSSWQLVPSGTLEILNMLASFDENDGGWAAYTEGRWYQQAERTEHINWKQEGF